MPQISIIIPCHNNLRTLPFTFKSIYSSAISDIDVVCVDDSSTEDIEVIAKSYNARYIRLPEGINGRRSLARQIGHFWSKGKITIYLDGDVIPDPRLITNSVKYYELYPRSIIKYPVYNISESNSKNNMDYIISLIIKHDYINLGLFLKKKSSIDTIPIPRRLLNKPTNYWMFCASNCFSIEKELIDIVDGWDISFEGWGEEDLEIAYRMYKIGVKFIYTPKKTGAAYHIDHPIDWDKNIASLLENVKYFREKHPQAWPMRLPILKKYLIDNNLLILHKFE